MSDKLSIASAIREAGRVSIGNSKMPGSTFAVTVDKCNVGGKLATVKGSTCHKCYAVAIEKRYPDVHKGWTNNYDRATALIATDPLRWSRFMAFQIMKAYEKTGEAYHRWFDGGDIASLEMLLAIATVCELTPTIEHWLPTREAAIVRAFLKLRAFPSNLVVRVSSTMVDDKPIKAHKWTSTVHGKGKAWSGVQCEARHRSNQCGPCRACWSHKVANVSYPLH
jgi:hypothetical protein